MSELLAKYIQAIGTALIGLGLLIGGVFFSYSYNQNVQPHTITVVGKATRAIPPNQSTLGGNWQEKGTTADEARSKLQDSSAKALAALKDAGIADKDITTTQVNVYPEYDYSLPVKQPKITGYQASMSLQVKLDDTSKADAIIAVMTKNGAVSTSGPSLGFSQEVKDQLEKDLRIAAVTDAANQAKALAEQSGGKLGDVISITNGSLNDGSTTPPIPYAVDSKAGAVAESSGISVGTQDLSVTVTATYRLR